MKLEQGESSATDGRVAVAEATRDWEETAFDLIIVFISTKQDPAEVADELLRRFPGVPTVGCTTAGEHLNGRHYNGSLVLTGIQSPRIRWTTARVDNVRDFDEPQARALTEGLFGQLGVSKWNVDPKKHFCLLFIDGLSLSEERVALHLANALEGVPVVGGSAGDDLEFRKTSVIHDGQAFSGGAVVVVGESLDGFEVIKHQHFKTTPRTLAITKADPDQRLVYEMDGYPALEAYARALGRPASQIESDVASLHPFTFSCDNEIYVRSIGKIEEDGSLRFLCGIEEGMVLEIGDHHDIGEALSTDLDRIHERIGQADLMVGCNCILRALESEKTNSHDRLGAAVNKAARHSIGFDTYGEQLNGLHINQTLVAIAFGGSRHG